jgi:E1A-binding protein p400
MTPKRASLFRDQLAEKVRQEAWVVRRVGELTREGLWSEKRLPKVCERPRGRTQWDVLLQEMRWLAVDFHQVRPT